MSTKNITFISILLSERINIIKDIVMAHKLRSQGYKNVVVMSLQLPVLRLMLYYTNALDLNMGF